MKVLLASAEVAPFAKVGGLADVAGSLPKALSQLDIDIRVIMPKYRQAVETADEIERVADAVPVYMSDSETGCAVDRTYLPGSDVPVYLIEHNAYFDREFVYGPPGSSYPDNFERLVFFCRAALQAAEAIGFEPDVVHLNDWHTSLIAAYTRMWDLPHATVFTAHNVGGAYQGTFSLDHLDLAGLDLGDRRARMSVAGDHINLARVGFSYGDMINTVSERYAQEIKDPTIGAGIHDLVAERGRDVWGILNGIDYDVWSPENDDTIASQYDQDDLSGKAICKSYLQSEFGLPEDEDVPLIGLVTRLDAQKGLDLVAEIVDDLDDCQVALLGTGSPDLEAEFARAAAKHDNIAARIEFSATVAHEVYAGADMFLMPSRYEPCGLGQMIALAYGTIPIVRRTGGLADSITEKGDTPNGFVFEKYSSKALKGAINRALKAYDDPQQWNELVQNAFNSDFSWDASARRYEELYEAALEKK
ncbi:MAG: glycogen synthase [Armatimonadota bacterium]